MRSRPSFINHPAVKPKVMPVQKLVRQSLQVNRSKKSGKDDSEIEDADFEVVN